MAWKDNFLACPPLDCEGIRGKGGVGLCNNFSRIMVKPLIRNLVGLESSNCCQKVIIV